MPLALHEVNALTQTEMRRLLLPLLEQDLNFFDRSYVTAAYQNPERFLGERRHLDSLRRIMVRYRDRLTLPRPEARPQRPGRAGQLLLGLEDEVSFDDFQARRVNRIWEGSFYEEFMADCPTDFPHVELKNSFREYMPSTDPKRPGEYTLKELAEKLPPGVLGLQEDRQGRPFNLLYRPEREDDPRKHLLLDSGWFAVRKMPEVVWAAATLEALNTLEETGLEYRVSKRASRWYNYITNVEPLAFKESPLFDYQEEAATFLIMRDRAMLSLSPGLGKTLTSAYAAGARHKLLGDVQRVLMVCPASLLHYWRSELIKWQDRLPLRPVPLIWHRQTLDIEVEPKPYQQLWAITNPETLVKHQEKILGLDPPFDLMILDESIMYKHRDSQRSQAVNEIAAQIPKLWMLTGAPATRYLDDLWHQFHILNNRGYSSYWRFAKRYCVVKETQWASTVVANRRKAEEEIRENFKDIYFARSQDQVTDIPDWLFEDVDVPMQSKQEAVYQKLQKDMIIQLSGLDDSETITVKNRLDLMIKSVQIASNPILVGAENSSGKWGMLPELMEIYPGPYIVWVNFIRTGEILLDTLKPLMQAKDQKVCLVNGATPMEERNNLVDKFQAGEYGVIIMNNTVGKFGFTLTRARTAFFVERMYDDSYFQCLHRNRRIGTVESPIVVNMRSVTRLGKRTIDHVIHDALDYRTGMIRKLTIGDLRGLFTE